MTGVDEYGLSVARTRGFRLVVLAGAALVVIWVLGTSRLFNSGANSTFHNISVGGTRPKNGPITPTTDTTDTTSSTSTAAPPPGPPIVGTGDDFFVVDALHHALNPPPPPPPPPPPEVPFPDNVAVIMETDVARVPNLVPVILHFASVLGPKWPVVLVTRRDRWVEPASPAFRRLMAERRLHVYFLPGDTAFADHRSVSVFLTRPWFWEQFESAGRVLLFQADSVVCGNSGRAVDDFLEWDLVGAPVAAEYGVGYNGGLALRNPRLVLEVVRDPANDFEKDSAVAAAAEDLLAEINKEEAKDVGPDGLLQGRDEEDKPARPAKPPPWMKFEDQWMYMKLKERGARLPDEKVAMTFAVETVYYDKPLGYHQPFRWLTDYQKKEAMKWCPEIGMLQDASHFF
ncbi:hypothetical protein diail_7398 [Diaporthe ilicicola]|nr:hypothetical protein diail_7398 [Diaporthe ilicicola]